MAEFTIVHLDLLFSRLILDHKSQIKIKSRLGQNLELKMILCGNHAKVYGFAFIYLLTECILLFIQKINIEQYSPSVYDNSLITI